MPPNNSTAVRQRRRKGAGPRELDYYPTPPWATRTFCEWLNGFYQAVHGREHLNENMLAQMRVWEPACGEMHMADPLAEYFGTVRASDCHPHTPDLEIYDFPLLGRNETDRVDWVITNPPFVLAEEFIDVGLRVAMDGVAVLVRSAFLEGQTRWANLFSKNPPTCILQHTDRVVMLDSRLVKYGAIDPVSGKPASSATAYCWLVWYKHAPHYEGTDFSWLPNGRKHNERENDYPDYSADEFEELPLFEGETHDRNQRGTEILG